MGWILRLFQRATFTTADLTEARAEGRREAYEAVAEWCRPLHSEAEALCGEPYQDGRRLAFRAVIGFCKKCLAAEQSGSRSG